MRIGVLLAALVLATSACCSKQMRCDDAHSKCCGGMCKSHMMCEHTKGECCGESCKSDAKPLSMDEKEIGKRFEAYATMGAEHKRLARFVGNWDTVVKTWRGPSGPVSESKGTSEIKAVFGGRFIQENFHGSMDGQPFEGSGVDGFDNIKKKYVAFWYDSMGTGVMNLEGSPNGDGKAVTYSCTFSCPITNGTRHSKLVVTLNDDDHWTLEMDDATPDGKEWKMMEIDYTRHK